MTYKFKAGDIIIGSRSGEKFVGIICSRYTNYYTYSYFSSLIGWTYGYTSHAILESYATIHKPKKPEYLK